MFYLFLGLCTALQLVLVIVGSIAYMWFGYGLWPTSWVNLAIVLIVSFIGGAVLGALQALGKDL